MSAKLGLDFETNKLDFLAPAGYFLGLHIRFTSPLMTFSTYPKSWMDHYTAQGYAMRDPIIAWGFSETGTIRWSEIPVPDPFEIMRQASDYGMAFGASISIGELTSRTIGSVSRDDREFTDAEISEVKQVVTRLHNLVRPPDALTDAQKEALQLVGDGLRHNEAAKRLGISESALKARLTTARSKLLARTTAEALQRAKQYNLL